MEFPHLPTLYAQANNINNSNILKLTQFVGCLELGSIIINKLKTFKFCEEWPLEFTKTGEDEQFEHSC